MTAQIFQINNINDVVFSVISSGIAYGSVYIGKKKNVNLKKLVLLY